ncbi:hypothetical protein BC938DRAFT_479163 [Jimgerdemannia flammicorona]|nr:hypothetical protein BC938DRAFT_479163 [Jimgerdemannia flammicorona]
MSLESVDSTKKLCVCGHNVNTVNWKDHQEVCVKRRLTCPAYMASKSIGYLPGVGNEEGHNEETFDVAPDSNMPRSLRSFALELVVNSFQDAKSSNSVLLLHSLLCGSSQSGFVYPGFLPDLIKPLANSLKPSASASSRPSPPPGRGQPSILTDRCIGNPNTLPEVLECLRSVFLLGLIDLKDMNDTRGKG